ncbi:hypothetical protein LNV23_23640 [Paucibacter sp. DJ1R-11]|nr:hypothetical protein [Paucibacter sp. DJ1R-11]MCV2366429.1 hypothetical protein [Paucibacter sp. DJ1R-11]
MKAAITIHLELPRLIGMLVGLSGEQVQAVCLKASPARAELIESVDV